LLKLSYFSKRCQETKRWRNILIETINHSVPPEVTPGITPAVNQLIALTFLSIAFSNRQIVHPNHTNGVNGKQTAAPNVINLSKKHASMERYFECSP